MATYAKLKQSSASAKAKPRRGPFAPDIAARAKCLVARYGFIARFEPENECYKARVVELPLVAGFGESPAEAIREAIALAETAVSFAMEEGQEPPPPGVEAARTEQVNFRVTVEERTRMEAAAQQHGLTLVDYIRGSALKIGQFIGPGSRRR